MRTSFLLVLTICATTANAAPVTWTLNDVVFGVGDWGTVTGSFVYDASTNIYSDIEIVTNGSGWDAAYTTLGGPSSGPTILGMWGSIPTVDVLVLEFVNPLTDAGGVIALEPGGLNGSKIFKNTDFVDITAGTVSAVPIPAALWLFGSALAVFGWIRKK